MNNKNNYFASEAELADARNRIETRKSKLRTLVNSTFGAHMPTPRQDWAKWELDRRLYDLVAKMKAAVGCGDIPEFKALEEKYETEVKDFVYPLYDEADLKFPDHRDVLLKIPPMFANFRANNPVACTFEDFVELAELYKEMAYHEACSPGKKRRPADEDIDQSMLNCLGSVIMGATIQLRNRNVVQMRALREQFDLILDAHHWDVLKPKSLKNKGIAHAAR